MGRFLILNSVALAVIACWEFYHCAEDHDVVNYVVWQFSKILWHKND
jgi:hypothetical protein